MHTYNKRNDSSRYNFIMGSGYFPSVAIGRAKKYRGRHGLRTVAVETATGLAIGDFFKGYNFYN